MPLAPELQVASMRRGILLLLSRIEQERPRDSNFEAVKARSARSCGYFFARSTPASTRAPSNADECAWLGAMLSGVSYIASHGKGVRHRQTHRPHRPDRAGPLAPFEARLQSNDTSRPGDRRWPGCRWGDRLSILRHRALTSGLSHEQEKPAVRRTAGFFHGREPGRPSLLRLYCSREPLGNRFASHSCTSARMLRPSSRKFS